MTVSLVSCSSGPCDRLPEPLGKRHAQALAFQHSAGTVDLSSSSVRNIYNWVAVFDEAEAYEFKEPHQFGQHYYYYYYCRNYYRPCFFRSIMPIFGSHVFAVICNIDLWSVRTIEPSTAPEGIRAVASNPWIPHVRVPRLQACRLRTDTTRTTRMRVRVGRCGLMVLDLDMSYWKTWI